jgi:hypothetical protein
MRLVITDQEERNAIDEITRSQRIVVIGGRYVETTHREVSSSNDPK